MNAVYQARPIKRKRRSKAQIEQLRQQILDELEDDHPQSVRHVFYRMVDPSLPAPVPKSQKHGYGPVQRQLAKLRKTGKLPYGWIVDMTRRGYFTETYDCAAEAVSDIDYLSKASSC